MSFSPPMPTMTSASATSVFSVPAMTTPFIVPTDCVPGYEHAFSINTHFTITDSVLYSNPSNPHFYDCRPSQLRSIASSLRNTFSPAVCPSNWVYNNIHAIQSGNSVISSAVCCSFGDYLSSVTSILGLEDVSSACVHSPSYGETTDSSTVKLLYNDTTTVFTSGFKIYPGYHVLWDSTDIPNLSPIPPKATHTGDPADSAASADLANLGTWYANGYMPNNAAPPPATLSSDPSMTNTSPSAYTTSLTSDQQTDIGTVRNQQNKQHDSITLKVALPVMITMGILVGLVLYAKMHAKNAQVTEPKEGSGREEPLEMRDLGAGRGETAERDIERGETTDRPPSFVSSNQDDEELPPYEPREEGDEAVATNVWRRP